MIEKLLKDLGPHLLKEMVVTLVLKCGAEQGCCSDGICSFNDRVMVKGKEKVTA